MKHLFFLILAVSITLRVSAQQVELQKGEKFKVHAWKSMIPLGKDKNYLYYQVSKERTYKAKKGFTVAKFDFQNRLILKNEIKLTGNAKKGMIQFYNTCADSLNLVYSFKNKDQKKTYFFRQTIDPNTLKINNNEKLICEVDWSSIKSDDADKIEFDLQFSTDSSKILLTYAMSEEKTNYKLHYGFVVLDQYYNLLWNYKAQSSPEENIITISNKKVSNDGTVYLGVKSYKNTADYKDNKHRGPIPGGSLFLSKYQLESQLYNTAVYCFKKDEEPLKYNLVLSKKHLMDMTFEPVDKNKLLCTGFYTAIDSYDVEGNFTCMITPESASLVDVEELKVYDEAFIKFGMNDKEIADYDNRKLKHEMCDFSNYRFKNIIHLPNGEFVAIAEKYFRFRIAGRNNTGTFDNLYQYSLDIFAIFMDKNGAIKTVSKIPKFQFDLVDMHLFPNKTYEGFQYTLFNDKLYFVFNKIDGSNIKFFVKVQDLIVVAMDMDGKITGKKIPIYDQVDSNISIDKGTWINDHTLGVYGFINATYKIYPITIKIKD